MNKFYEWLAWKLPKKLVYWAAIRVASFATIGKYSHVHPDKLSVMEAIGVWEEEA